VNPVATVPDAAMVDEIGVIAGLELRVWDLAGLPPEPERIHVVVAPYLGDLDRLAALASLRNLELVQSQSAGYEGWPERLPVGVRLANGAGIHDASTAELAVGLTIASLRGFPGFVRAQAEQRWDFPGTRPSLADRKVLVLGYGSIGRALVRRLLAFEVEVTAVASRARPGDGLMDRVHGVDELPALLPAQDVVVVLVPMTERTHHLVDDGFLSALPDGALVVNVARGGIVDTDAALRHAGRLLFALDVTDPEPLPDGHPLWSAPGVLISPHVGGPTTAMRPRAVRLVRRQLERYAGGRPLLNLVHGG
jgi:phosphoglycerate dehydrogenase-like enzyme